MSVPECVVRLCGARGTMLSVEEFEAESSHAMGIPSDAAVEKVCTPTQRLLFVAPTALQMPTEQRAQRWRAASEDFAVNYFTTRVKSSLPSHSHPQSMACARVHGPPASYDVTLLAVQGS